MKKKLISIVIILIACVSCTKEAVTPVYNQKQKDTPSNNQYLRAGGLERNFKALSFSFTMLQSTNLAIQTWNMTSNNLGVTMSNTRCDGTSFIDYRFYYGAITADAPYNIATWADALADNGIMNSGIFITGYGGLSPCPTGTGISYVGNNLFSGTLNWGGSLYPIQPCHYMNADLKVFENKPDTLYIQVYYGQPVQSVTYKYWK